LSPDDKPPAPGPKKANGHGLAPATFPADLLSHEDMRQLAVLTQLHAIVRRDADDAVAREREWHAHRLAEERARADREVAQIRALFEGQRQQRAEFDAAITAAKAALVPPPAPGHAAELAVIREQLEALAERGDDDGEADGPDEQDKNQRMLVMFGQAIKGFIDSDLGRALIAKLSAGGAGT
jgi:hypothetical protein